MLWALSMPEKGRTRMELVGVSLVTGTGLLLKADPQLNTQVEEILSRRRYFLARLSHPGEMAGLDLFADLRVSPLGLRRLAAMEDLVGPFWLVARLLFHTAVDPHPYCCVVGSSEPWGVDLKQQRQKEGRQDLKVTQIRRNLVRWIQTGSKFSERGLRKLLRRSKRKSVASF